MKKMWTAIMLMRKWFLISALIAASSYAGGCASYTIRDSEGRILSQGTSYGFLRTMTIAERYNDNGKCIERKISTDAHTKEVLMGLNEFIDTTINTIDRVKP